MSPIRNVVFVLALTGCASGGSSPVIGPSAAPIVLVGGSGMPTGDGAGAFTHSTIMSDRPVAYTLRVPGTPADVWNTAVRVYGALDIPVTFTDVPLGQLGTKNVSKRRTLGQRRLSEFMDCGSGATGQNADFFRIQMAVTTSLTAEGPQTLVQTLLTAYGQDVEGVSSGPVQCASTGGLEGMINRSIEANLPKRPSPL